MVSHQEHHSPWEGANSEVPENIHWLRGRRLGKVIILKEKRTERIGGSPVDLGISSAASTQIYQRPVPQQW